MSAPTRTTAAVAELRRTRPGSVDSLAWSAGIVPEQALPAFRRLAFATGRVVERDHLAVLGLGEAATIEMPLGLGAPGAAKQAERALAALPALGSFVAADGSPPELAAATVVALCALPFDSSAAARLVIPELTVVLRDGCAPVGIACGEPDELARLRRSFPFDDLGPVPVVVLGRAPDRFELVAVHAHAEFEQLIALAVAEIRRGSFEKVVCAREVAVTANRPFEQAHLLERLRALYPACATFGLDGFVGASPELLVRRSGPDVTSQPLAGTIPRSGDPEEDARLAKRLLASSKDRREHALVVSAIEAALAPLSEPLDSPPAPHLLDLRNVSHLATALHARLRPLAELDGMPTGGVTAGAAGAAATGAAAAGAAAAGDAGTADSRAVGDWPGALSVVAAMHPTPAVGGVPTDAALAFLAAHEGLERGRYAGAVGWVDGNGDGEMWLGIRSAMISGATARLIAGVGIVEGSDPHEELVETQLKLQALLAAAVRP